MSSNTNPSQGIPFNFTYYAMKLLGKNLYSNPWTAVSEIVANGIDSKASKVHVLVDMRDKQHAKVEIFDNGQGMTPDDLRTKYTYIGRNKRNSDENISGKTLGRKGIGKLAALYLSPRYYLYSKKGSSSTAWYVNTSGIDDSAIPTMQPVENSESRLIAKDLWSAQVSGTMIHLSDVDLRKIGPERLKRLPINLADYYLDTAINCQILVCVLLEDSDAIDFKPISKEIHYDTMYAMFDNTELGYKDKLQEKVYVTSVNTRPEVDIPRETQVLSPDKFETQGVLKMIDLKGQECDVPYELTGWIGIHASLDSNILKRNSSNAIKRPNTLRLYVRGKLAVSNMMSYLSMAQAMTNYIEGEISFDVLDDDEFEDASTSSREGYSISDPRIKKLIDILRKIVRSLINERTEIGNKIAQELKEIEDREKEEKRCQLEEERKKAEEAERKKRDAEAEALRAAEAQRSAEAEAKKESAAREEAEKERDQIKEESAGDKKRLFVLENNFISSGEQYKHGVHLAVNYAKEIRGTVMDISDELDCTREQLLNYIMDIDKNAEKVERLPHYIESINFQMNSPDLETDLLDFIQQYIEQNGSSRLQYEFNIMYDIRREIDFPEIIMFVDNVISNAIKAKAKTLKISSQKHENRLQIDFSDDGTGLKAKYQKNPEAIFKLGETTTIGGFGIGCYQMKKIIQKLNGEIYAIPNTERGMTFRVVI